jgi:small-conductance mechanosensitive channel
MQLSLPQPKGLPIFEIVRTGVAFLILIGLAIVIYQAILQFAGGRGRRAKPWHFYFAGISFLTLIFLLAIREPVEMFIATAAKPLDRLTENLFPALASSAFIGLFRTLIATLALVLILQMIGRAYWFVEGRLRRRQPKPSGFRMHLVVAATSLLKLLRTASILFLVVSFLPLFMSFFPRSAELEGHVVGYFGTPAKHIGEAIVEYLPNLAYLIVITVIGHYSLKVLRYLFEALERGTLVIKGFYPEWAKPTHRLLWMMFLLFLLMVSYPYLPGSNSQFFQGFSVFVGAIITFGSSSAIGNIMAGTVLTYTRAFHLGDMVTIGDKTGVVVDKNLLVTRLRTPQNEEVSIPNSNVLSSSVLNYSALAVSDGLTLTVKAGIGYDVGWSTVHQLMIQSARATEYVLAKPVPEVWQSELGDYAVNYELRAFTDRADLMWSTLSLLRQNVLDSFNRAGVEIMTPSILAHRDASHLAVPLDEFPNRPKPNGIAIDVKPK